MIKNEKQSMLFKLDIRHHCIETAVKKLYNKSISQYFKTGGDKEKLEKKIDILKNLLEKCDFTYLRRTHSELAGHCRANVAISTDAENRITIVLNGQHIRPYIAK
ncbi:MAG: hypothetical protein B6I22_10005 [Desulfobacteraceae bacterium 4572_123]|nr:MAG: hypothetical protein B6I22_10005 [Desulfobacteraceae bacterium 4572_123]